MRKIKCFTITFLLITTLIGCSFSKNQTIKTKDIITNKKVVETDASSNLKVYKNIEYGYEVSYPQNYDVSLSGGHSPLSNPEFGMRLSLYSKNGQPKLDIDSIDKVNYKDKYQNAESFIKYKHLNVKLDEDFIINDKNIKIYKLENDNYYFSFLENEKYIFEFSSSSKDILKKIITNFKFI